LARRGGRSSRSAALISMRQYSSAISSSLRGAGARYQFRDQGGIEMEFLLKSAADVDRLEVEA